MLSRQEQSAPLQAENVGPPRHIHSQDCGPRLFTEQLLGDLVESPGPLDVPGAVLAELAEALVQVVGLWNLLEPRALGEGRLPGTRVALNLEPPLLRAPPD
eukprot:2946995-Pyramimonas_sp.AAC.1